ncbi:osmosensing histidine protein kinase SLN1 [Xylariaceae sp. FL0016]|nr:osmosensing histidine protein kinase SLN1 [Xylariaceae sp. FL0016]
MRVAIREQLAALVVFTVLIALAIVAIPTWVYVYHFVVGVETSGLSLAASLKSAQVSNQIELIQTTCTTISTRLLVQTALSNFYVGNVTQDDWTRAAGDLRSALNTDGTKLLQARLYSRNETGQNETGLLSVTGNVGQIQLPYPGPDGSNIYVSNDTDTGFPSGLYPNITYSSSDTPDPYNPGHNVTIARPFPEIRIDSAAKGLILGPLVINQSYALMSLTLPIRQNAESDIVLGYMTVLAEANPVLDILSSEEGLGSTGCVLLVGPATGWNRFNKYDSPSNATYQAKGNFSDVGVHFVFPPATTGTGKDRHAQHSFASGNSNDTWPVGDYKAALKAFTKKNPAINNASSTLTTKNEQGIAVAVGYARPRTELVDWTLIVEQAKSEAYVPIHNLQNILLGTVFGTTGVILLLVFPCAHFGVLPIRKLKAATEKSISPPGYTDAYLDDMDYDDDERPGSGRVSGKEKGVFVQLRRLVRRDTKSRMTAPSEPDSDPRRRVFKIPGKVHDRRHYITDELTELTTTFNDMSDELLRQYTSLEEKVANRTRDLELSKKAAEAANESKTLFIANISHELKTPLNGILGMASVCMEEDDIHRIKQNLKLLYKSGDLLFHLLEDLLSFSKNQIGQQLSLEEKEFRLGEIRAQVVTIFDKQVRERKISFTVDFVGTDTDFSQDPSMPSIDGKLPALGPHGVGRVKDMCLWGDQHRILQVIINLVSNSLKFTPSEGSVAVRIKCVGEVEQMNDEGSRTSSFSKSGSARHGRSRQRLGSGSQQSVNSRDPPTPGAQGTALQINPMNPRTSPLSHLHERSQTPPPPSAKTFMFEFEVQDTGPGIPEHMQQRVFEPFVQGDLGLSKKYGGTGLGLSICSQLANLMGGSIDLKSTVGVGTTFTMHIPLKYTKDRPSSTASSSLKSRAPSISSSAEGEPRRSSLTQATADAKASVLEQQPRLVGLSQPFFTSGPKTGPQPTPEDQMKAVERAREQKGEGKLRILVAEDNHTNIEVVRRMLKLEEVYDVTIANDGQEAYDLVKANMENNLHFDLIFMDIQMPNVDGLQSTRLIRKMGYSAPIVALTAFADESNVKNCMESGMNEFLSKPIRRPALKQVLKKFATIPEEPETASLTRKSTPEKPKEDTPTGDRATPIVAEDPKGSVSANGKILDFITAPQARPKNRVMRPGYPALRTTSLRSFRQTLPSARTARPPWYPSDIKDTTSATTTRLFTTSLSPAMRVPYVPNPPPTSTPEDAAVVQRIEARRAPRPLQPLDLALLHSPAVADGWNSFLGAVRTRTTLPAALRELAICRVAVCNAAWYEWGHHAPLATAAGLGDRAMAVCRAAELGAVGEEEMRGAREDGMGEREWAVLRYADEMTRVVRVSDETFALLKGCCSDKEVVEVTATVAAYNCVSRFLVALDVGERNSTGPDDAAH